MIIYRPNSSFLAFITTSTNLLLIDCQKNCLFFIILLNFFDYLQNNAIKFDDFPFLYQHNISLLNFLRLRIELVPFPSNFIHNISAFFMCVLDIGLFVLPPGIFLDNNKDEK